MLLWCNIVAIKLLKDYVCDSRNGSRIFLCEINQLLTGHVKRIPAIDSAGNRVMVPFTSGRYRTNPTHVITSSGLVHKYVDAHLIDDEMQMLIHYINNSSSEINPIVKAAVAHYYNFVRIHPFQDGNGRGSRIRMNQILMRANLLPSIVYVNDRADSIAALKAADKGDIIPFVKFITYSTEKTLDMLLDTIEKELTN